MAVGRSVLLHGCETEPVRTANDGILDVKGSFRHMLRVRRGGCVSTADLHCRFCLNYIQKAPLVWPGC